jgi:hypothetical protein
MGAYIIESMMISLVLTLLIEELFVLIIGIRRKEDLLLVLLVNILTNPVVVFLYQAANYYLKADMRIITVFLEAAAIFAEAGYYAKYSRNIRHPLLVSVGANVISFGIGEWIRNGSIFII